MPISLSGTLRDPYGNALGGAAIRFDAVATSSDVLQHTSAATTTDTDGRYTISVEFGRYNIRIQTERSFYDLANNVLINADTTAATLNALVIDAQGYDDLTPQIVLEFRALRDETRGYRDEAALVADAAADQARSYRDAAQSAAADASESAKLAAAIYPSVSEALADPGAGAYFKVPESGYLQLYRNSNGSAVPIMRLASEDTLRAMQQLPDPILTSLLF